MGDQAIKLRWAGQGSILAENITPISLILENELGYGEVQGSPEEGNMLIEGDNAPVMKSLCSGRFNLRGKIDFMLWDPPYNTGNTGAKGFIYEDNFYLTKSEQKKWSEKNKKVMIDLGVSGEDGSFSTGKGERDERWVRETDASKHSKWLSWMEVRLNLAKKLLKKSGVIAVHIGFQELFRLGLLMDEIFGEENRLGIINWECSYGSKPKEDRETGRQKGGLPSTTDYVLVYAKNKDMAFRGKIERSDSMDARYKSPDRDPNKWKNADLSTSLGGGAQYVFEIENPITGKMFKPSNGRHWSVSAQKARDILCEWGVEYEVTNQGNCVVKNGEDRTKALAVQERGTWPLIYFGKKGVAGPAAKHYHDRVKDKGKGVGTYFHANDAIDDQDESIINGTSFINDSLPHHLSEHNDAAKKLIKSILGGNCVFDTPKPLKLTKRLIQMFCPEDGVVLDAFAGSGTVGHAVLDLNKNNGHLRRFILIERGGVDIGYANPITAERIRRVIDGKWEKPTSSTTPLGGGFSYYKGGTPISAESILESKRDDLVDIILTSHVGSSAVDSSDSKYIIGRTLAGNAIALVWGDEDVNEQGKLTPAIHKEILADSKRLGLTARPAYIYGSVNAGPNGSSTYLFHQIPDEILAALGIQNLSE